MKVLYFRSHFSMPGSLLFRLRAGGLNHPLFEA